MKDQSAEWIKQNLEEAKKQLWPMEIGYCSLSNKRTKYAKGILRVIEAKRKVVKIWEEA